MSTLRKNASLKTVAKFARRKAADARDKYDRVNEVWRNRTGSTPTYVQFDAIAAFTVWQNLDDIATHLERLTA